jgi:multidrug efflux pump subunit AcrA (membrane-fusion protein)
MSKHKHPAISVASPRDNFRRAGHVFGTKPITLALAALHPDAHAAILADQSLVKVDTVVHLDREEASALLHRDAPHVKAAAAKLDTLPAIDEDHAKRAVALADIEADLRQRKDALDARQTELDERTATLDSLESDLSIRLADFERSKAEFEASKVAASISGKGAAPAHGSKR